jgi:hypothetical protein
MIVAASDSIETGGGDAAFTRRRGRLRYDLRYGLVRRV